MPEQTLKSDMSTDQPRVSCVLGKTRLLDSHRSCLNRGSKPQLLVVAKELQLSRRQQTQTGNVIRHSNRTESALWGQDVILSCLAILAKEWSPAAFCELHGQVLFDGAAAC